MFVHDPDFFWYCVVSFGSCGLLLSLFFYLGRRKAGEFSEPFCQKQLWKAAKRLVFLCVAGLSSPSLASAEIRPLYERWGQSWAVFYTGWAEEPEQACRAAGSAVPVGGQWNYYYGLYYASNYEGNSPWTRICVDEADHTAPVNLYCFFVDDKNTASEADDVLGKTLGACRTPVCTGQCCGTQGGGGSPGGLGSPPGTATFSRGDPVELASRTEFYKETDWFSAEEPRFRFDRFYRSDGATVVAGNLNQSRLNHAGVWRGGYEEYFAFDDTFQWHTYFSSDGGRHKFLHDGNFTPAEFSAGYEVANWSGWEMDLIDPSGVVRHFVGDVQDRVLTSVTWPDGYKITIERTNSQISTISDNRGNRAVYTWSTSLVPNSTTPLVWKVEVDTNFTGTFAPEVRLQYAYTQNLMTEYPPLSSVSRTDMGTATTVQVASYTYQQNSVIAGAYLYPLLLTSISDGRSGGTPYTFFDYNLGVTGQTSIDYSQSPSGLIGLNIRPVAANYMAGNNNRYEFDNTGFTWPLGRRENHTFAVTSGEQVTSQVEGVATPNCLATMTQYSYVAPAGQPAGFLYERQERNGSFTRFTRDAQGRVLTRTEDATGASPRTTTYTWPTSSLRLPLTRETAELRETFGYDAAGLLTSYSQTDMLAGSPSFGTSRVWTYSYNTLTSGLKVLVSMDGPGLASAGINDVTTFAYDASGRLTTVTDPVGRTNQSLAFGALGLPTQIKDEQGFLWSMSYDINGRLLTATFDPATRNETWTFAYDEVGQLVSTTDNRGLSWAYVYDAARRLTDVIGPNSEKISFDHDAMGNVTRSEYLTTTGTIKFWEETQYDELGRILRLVGAQGQHTDFSHDEEDNLVTEVDALGLPQTNVYDPLNRVVQAIDRAGNTTNLEVDVTDDLTKFTDPRGIETSFVRNGFGEVVSEVSADRGTHLYTYDSRGLVQNYTDPRGVVSNYVYDNAGRLVSRHFPSDTTQNIDLVYSGATNNSRQYRLRWVDDKVGRTWIYDDLTTGDLGEVRSILNGITYKVQVNFINDRGVPNRLLYPSGATLQSIYDTQGRIKELRWAGKDPTTGAVLPWVAVVKNVLYEPFGPIRQFQFADSLYRTEAHDSSYRLTREKDISAGSTITLNDVKYSWNTLDNLSQTTNMLTSQTGNFAYDSREHLSSADGNWGNIDYGYDTVGNRNSLTALVNGTLQTDLYSYPATSNRLQSVAYGAGGSRSLTYDAAGNVTYDNRNGQGYSYTYDAANRMSSFSINGVVQAEYEYNHLGQQAIRRLTQTGQVIHSVFDFAGHRIAEYLYNPTTGTSGLIREYLWLEDRIVGVFEAGQLYMVRTDHIGRPAFATNTSGVKVWEASYGPFGEVVASTGPAIGLRFPGQWFQSETGLYQNWMRDYDPTLGRYLQADPLGLVDGASVYGYARGNPGVNTDPTGEFIPVAILAGVAIGAGLDFALQYWMNDGRIECVNWAQVGLGGALGAFTGGWGSAWKAGATGLGRSGAATQAAYRTAFGVGKESRVHHAIFSAGGAAARARPGFQHSWWNYRAVANSTHKGLHRYSTVPRLSPLQHWLYGTPEWLLGAEASAGLGSTAEFMLGDTCGCEN